jgi:hypothetical protein
VAAQSRLFLPTLPDLDLFGLAAPEWHGGDELHLEFSGRTETWLGLGRAGETAEGYSLTGAAGAGWRPNKLTLVVVRGDATGSGDYQGANPASALRGWHRLYARTGIGDPGDDPMGIDVTARYNGLHAGNQGWVLPPSDVAWGENFSDERVEIGLWPRTGDDRDLVGVLPFRYALRKVTYPRGGGPVGGFTTQTFSSGIGIRGYDDEIVDGWWEFIGVSYSRTKFAAPAGTFNPLDDSLPSHGRIDWRALNFDHIVLAENDFLLGLNYSLGASWLWDPKRDSDYAIFTGEIGVRARFEDGEVGLGMAREALATPDGQRFTEAFRFEGLLEITPEGTGIGAGIRGAYHQFGNNDRGPDPVSSGAVHSRWFLTPTPWSKIGAYHLAHLGARVEGGIYDPIHYDRAWSHELGIFLELNDSL